MITIEWCPIINDKNKFIEARTDEYETVIDKELPSSVVKESIRKEFPGRHAVSVTEQVMGKYRIVSVLLNPAKSERREVSRESYIGIS